MYGESVGPGLHLSYFVPDGRLDGLVTGYHRYAVTAEASLPHCDVLFPSWAVLRFQRASSDWRVTIGSTTQTITDSAVVFGPASHAIYSVSGAGQTVGVGLTPRGWRRFASSSSEQVANRIVRADRVLPDIDGLQDRLGDGNIDDDALVEIFDQYLLDRLGKPHPDEERIAAIHRDLMDVPDGGVDEMAERLDISVRSLHRLTRSAFGFGPKLLLRRARFLRSLIQLMAAPERRGSLDIDSSYYDYAHFLRDCRLFLGMSPRRFRELPKPLMEASIRLRLAKLGAPAQALAQPARTNRAPSRQGVRHPQGEGDRSPLAQWL